MVCSQCQELLSEYIDGALELGEQVNIERHLSDCEPCRAVRDDLLQIVHFSQQLPVQAPSTSLWPRINAGLAELQPSFWNRSLRWLHNVRALNFNFSVPQMIATAAVIAIVVSTGVILSRHDNGTTQVATAGITLSSPDTKPLSQADLQVLEKQISQLSETVEQKKDSWDPELRNAFERNLLYVNQSLAECRHQLSDQIGRAHV